MCVCPVEAPFMAANGTCIICDRPRFWNERDRQCVSCAEGFIYDYKQFKCICP